MAMAVFAMGAATAAVHVIVPFAAHLAAPEERGRVVGVVLGGLLFGVLLARTFSGALGAAYGWRSVFAIAAALMFALAAVVRLRLPISPPELTLSWLELMRSTGALIRRHAVLRESALLGSLSFAAFSAFWTTLIFFLQSPAYSYGSVAAGLFGLVGAAGAAGAPTFGHLADKHGPRRTIAIAVWVTLGAFLIIGAAGATLIGLIAGVIVMDLGVQLSNVSNQTRIYQIDPQARSRLNMVYMVACLTGGALGSLAGAEGWRVFGWWGVCGFGALTQVSALVVQARLGARAAVSPASAGSA
jgi:predicted MFS family arabinose efflux permease